MAGKVKLKTIDVPSVLTVSTAGDGGSYSTISAALADANDGDTILVFPGDYAETFTISSPVKIIGLGTTFRDGVLPRTRIRPTLTTNGSKAIVDSSGANEVLLENLEIRPIIDNPESASGSNTILDFRYSNLILRNCRIGADTALGIDATVLIYGLLFGTSTFDCWIDNCIFRIDDTNNYLSETPFTVYGTGFTGTMRFYNGTVVEDGDNITSVVYATGSNIIMAFEDCLIDKIELSNVQNAMYNGATQWGILIGSDIDRLHYPGKLFQISLTIEDPTNTEDVSWAAVYKAATVERMKAVLSGSGSQSVSWTVRHGSDRNATGTEVETGGRTTTSITTGDTVTTFDNPNIDNNSFIWLETTATVATVDELHVTVWLREN